LTAEQSKELQEALLGVNFELPNASSLV